MSGKARAIEKANRRLLTEDIPAPVTNITEYEVFSLLEKIYEGNEYPENIVEAFRDLLRSKGKFIPTEPLPPLPPGAYY